MENLVYVVASSDNSVYISVDWNPIKDFVELSDDVLTDAARRLGLRLPARNPWKRLLGVVKVPATMTRKRFESAMRRVVSRVADPGMVSCSSSLDALYNDRG
jgi:hypothetical protein